MTRDAGAKRSSPLAHEDDADTAPTQARANPVLLLSAVLALAFTLIALVQRDDADAVAEAPPVIPELFEATVRCTQPRAAAHHHATALEARALAKNERAPWRAQDGVEAALCLAEARACYQLSGDAERAEALTPLLRRWQRKLQADYRRVRLQLEFSLRKAKDSLAEEGSVPDSLTLEIRTQVAVLQALLSHREGPYRDWLEKLSRKYAQQEKSS
jgi:hypothetical protein